MFCSFRLLYYQAGLARCMPGIKPTLMDYWSGAKFTTELRFIIKQCYKNTITNQDKSALAQLRVSQKCLQDDAETPQIASFVVGPSPIQPHIHHFRGHEVCWTNLTTAPFTRINLQFRTLKKHFKLHLLAVLLVFKNFCDTQYSTVIAIFIYFAQYSNRNRK